jgi:hypothetical protein
MGAKGEVLSHWYHLFEGFSTSGKEFYAKVEVALKSREVPDISVERVDYAEGGITSAKREYLRVRRGMLAFDLCAAPFGTGYFFSWWLTSARGPWILILILTFVADLFLGWILGQMFGRRHGMAASLFTWAALVPLWIGFSRMFGWRGRDVLFSIPFIGRVLEAIFSPDTYYKIDTMLMFQEAVRGAVNQELDCLTEQKGLRALSPDEREPKMRNLAK